MKVEGASGAVGHPVTYKLAHIKTLLEKLKPLDQKLDSQIDRVLSSDIAAEE